VVGFDGNSYHVENQTFVSEDWINGIGIGDTDGDGNTEIGLCNDSDVVIIIGFNGIDYQVEWEGGIPAWIPMALDIASMDDDPEEEIFVKGAFNFPLIVLGWDGSGYIQEASLEGYDMTFEQCLAVDEVLSETKKLVIGSMSPSMLEYSGGYSEIWTGDMMSSNALGMKVGDVDIPSDIELSLAYNGMIVIYGDKIPPQPELSVSKYVITVGDEIQFNATNSTGVEPLQYSFDYGDGNSTGWMSVPFTSYIYSSPGTYSASLKVMDARLIESEQAAAITITVDPPNQKPVAYIDFISPSPAVQGEFVYFEGHGEDDGTISGYEWKSSKNGYISYKNTFAVDTLYVGVHTIYFRVMDNKEVWSDAAFVNLKIERKPQPPSAIIDVISPNPALVEEIISFEGHGDDEDGSVTGYYWESDLDGFLSSKSSFETSSLSIGVHTVSFKVRDNEDLWSELVFQSLNVTPLPENILPVAVIDSVSPDKIEEGDSVTFIGHGEDDDGEIIDYYWESDLDGLLSDLRTFSTSDLSAGTHSISFMVKDDRGDWSESEVFILKVEEIEEEPGFLDITDPEENPLPCILLPLIIIVIVAVAIAVLASRRRRREQGPDYDYYEVESY
jgi:PKD repeat protein